MSALDPVASQAHTEKLLAEIRARDAHLEALREQIMQTGKVEMDAKTALMLIDGWFADY